MTSRTVISKQALLTFTWKGKYWSMDNTKYGKWKGKFLSKIEEISGGKAHTKIHRNILMITDVFLNKKRVNVCEYMVKESIYLMTIAKEELIFISLLLVSTGIFWKKKW